MATETLAFKMGDHEAWRTEYKGHEILIVNKGRTRLLVDGNEVAVQTGRLPIATKLQLIGSIPDSDEIVIATLNGSMKNEYKGIRTEVHIFIGKELDKDYGVVDPNRNFTHIDEVFPVQTTIKRKAKKNKPRRITLKRKKKTDQK